MRIRIQPLNNTKCGFWSDLLPEKINLYNTGSESEDQNGPDSQHRIAKAGILAGRERNTIRNIACLQYLEEGPGPKFRDFTRKKKHLYAFMCKSVLLFPFQNSKEKMFLYVI